MRETEKKDDKAYKRVLLARDKNRPNIVDYTEALFDDFLELRGDRLGGEDPAVYGGIAFFEGRPVTVIGHRKGRSLQENLTCNFGMPNPEGYRKALRLMKQAEKFRRPVISFIDTPGAYPGIEAEEHGQSIAIAENLQEMSRLRVPILVIVTGEGNSGGALAIGLGDRLYMLENAVYSILSPEGFASILWKDSSRKKEACNLMHLTAEEIYEDGFADGVLEEGRGGIQKNREAVYERLRLLIRKNLTELMTIPEEELLRQRYEKYRRIGQKKED